MTASKFGSALRDCDKVAKSARRDPWANVLFVDDAQQPPTDGLLALWVVCTVLALLLGGYLIWGPK